MRISQNLLRNTTCILKACSKWRNIQVFQDVTRHMHMCRHSENRQVVQEVTVCKDCFVLQKKLKKKKTLSTLLIHCKVTCISEFLTINNIFNLKFPFLWQTIMEIMRVMKNMKCQLLSIQEQLAIIYTANATSNIPHKKSVKNFVSVSTWNMPNSTQTVPVNSSAWTTVKTATYRNVQSVFM